MYTFTCPLDGCEHHVMTSPSQNIEEAVVELTATAEAHLRDMHHQVHKTHEEVAADIRSHMVQG